ALYLYVFVGTNDLECREEGWRLKINRAHASLAAALLIMASVLMLSGFGHDLVDLLLSPPQSAPYLSYVLWIVPLCTLIAATFTGLKASPRGGGDQKQARGSERLNHLVFAITPPLVVLVIATVLSWTATEILRSTSRLGASNSSSFIQRVTPAILFAVALCW